MAGSRSGRVGLQRGSTRSADERLDYIPLYGRSVAHSEVFDDPEKDRVRLNGELSRMQKTGIHHSI
jgi:hypothetical protein